MLCLAFHGVQLLMQSNDIRHYSLTIEIIWVCQLNLGTETWIWFHGCTCVYILKLGCNVSPGIPLTGILMQNITCINHWWIQCAADTMQCVVQYYVKWNVSLNLSLKNLFRVFFLNVCTNAVWLTVHHLLRLSKYYSKNFGACDSMPPPFNGTFFSRSSQLQHSGSGATAKNRQSCQETDGEAI